jgi:drug/metabolite transporter (DMT)-like permease
MTLPQKNFLGITFSILSVLAYAMEWWFVRELEAFHLNGFLLMGFLFSIAAILFSFGIFLEKNRKNFPKKGKKSLFIFGIIEFTVFSFFALALLEISVVKTLLWSNLAAFYILILSPFLLNESLTIRKTIAGVFGFGGMAIYLLIGNTTGNILELSTGDLYGFICGILVAVRYFIASKNKEHPLFWKLFFAWFPAVFFLPFLLFFFNFDFSLFTNLYLNLIFFGLLFSSILLANFFNQLAIEYIDISKVAIVSMFEPVFQGITAFLIANETLTLPQGIGVMAILFGIFLIRK